MIYLRIDSQYVILTCFRLQMFILINGKDKLGEFDAKFDEGIFLRYSSSITVYRVLKNRNSILEELVHVEFNESKPQEIGKCDSSSFDASGMVTKYLVKYDIPYMNPSKSEDIKDGMEKSGQEDDK